MSHIDTLRVLGALTLIVVIFYMLIQTYGTSRESLSLYVPGLLASLVVALSTYSIGVVFFPSFTRMIKTAQIEEIARLLADELKQQEPFVPSVKLYDSWYAIGLDGWSEILDDAVELEVVVPFFESWFNHAGRGVKEIFERGGTVRFYLTDPRRAPNEAPRFPPLNRPGMKKKLEGTAIILRNLHGASRSAGSTLEIFSVNAPQMMHCLMRIKYRGNAKRRVIIHLQDHFRLNDQRASPTFLVDVDKYYDLSVWIDQEFAGFQQVATPWP